MRPAPFFVVRSPLLEGHTSRAPDELVRDPIVREAVDLASPSLLEALDGKRKSRVDVWPPITRYLERMKGRCTPFSLMSGYAVGSTPSSNSGATSSVRFVARAHYRRVVRLDVDTIGRAVGRYADANPSLVSWVAPQGLAIFPDLIRLTSRSDNGNEVRLKDIERSEALDQILAAAASPTSFAALVDLILPLAGGGREEADGFVTRLIGEGLLVPAAMPPVLVTDEVKFLDGVGEAASHLAEHARRARSTPLGEPAALEGFAGMAEFRPEAPSPTEETEDGEKAPTPEGGEAKPKTESTKAEGDEQHDSYIRSLIFDLVKPTETATLGNDVISAIRELVGVFPRVTFAPQNDSRLDEFCRRFLGRYEGREVSLIEAVDPRRGFGFPFQAEGGKTGSDESDLAEWIFALFERSCRTGTNVELQESDLLKPVRWKLQESFSATFELALDPLCLWDVSIGSAPGTLLFARAAAVLPDTFRAQVTAYLSEVSAREPNVDFADVAYFVPGRSASFTQYPLLQPKELTLTPTSSDVGKSIDVNDLVVSVGGGRVRLRSAKTGRVVKVRTTGAANPNRHDTTDLYRFLCAVGHQGAPMSKWSWGPCRRAARLPRVSYKGHVLAEAEWNLRPAETEVLRKAKTREARWDEAQKLRSTFRLPRHIRYHEAHDHLLPVDLDDPWSVEAWADIAHDQMRIVEAFPLERSAVVGPEGPFHHQIVVPFMGDIPTQPAAVRADPLLPPEVVIDRILPGGSVLYLSFWGDADELMTIVQGLVEDVVRPLQADGGVTHWFFLPFSDPDPHIRLRLFGDPARLWSPKTLLSIEKHLGPHAKQRAIQRFSLETYDRETYRYGGARGIELAERVFHASSEISLEMHAETTFDVESGPEIEAVMVPYVSSLRALLDATGLPLDGQRAIAQLASVSYNRAKDPNIPRKRGADVYRKIRDRLSDSVATMHANDAIRERLTALRPVLAEAQSAPMLRPFPEWMTDCLHVHSIRILTTWHPVADLEATAYHLLHKLLGTETALKKPPSKA